MGTYRWLLCPPGQPQEEDNAEPYDGSELGTNFGPGQGRNEGRCTWLVAQSYPQYILGLTINAASSRMDGAVFEGEEVWF